jgi:GTP-binding protein EngB required for normal cell division
MKSQHTPPLPSFRFIRAVDDNASDTANLRKEMQSVLAESSDRMVDEVFAGFAGDMLIVVCGSPRVGKSTLINAICGRKLATAKEGLASVTHAISCYTTEGQCVTESGNVHYKYTFWDTPGFDSWEKCDIRSKVTEIIEKPESKPLCMIFCASPGTFVDLTQLDWLLNLCIKKSTYSVL